MHYLPSTSNDERIMTRFKLQLSIVNVCDHCLLFYCVRAEFTAAMDMRMNNYAKQREMVQLRETIFNYEQRDADFDLWYRGFRDGRG